MAAFATGTLIRKKALSSRIVFLDIQVDDGCIVGVCVKGACAGVGSAADARSFLKVGDVLEVTGGVDGVDAEIILAHRIRVVLPWCEAGKGAPFPGPRRLPNGQHARRGAASSTGGSTDKAIVPPGEASSRDASSPGPVLQLICPSFVNTGQCSKWRCGLRHTSDNLKEERREWVSARLASRGRLATAGGDPVDPHDKASSGRRASVFAAWLIDMFGRDALCGGSGVLDVAGGRGALSFELGVAGIPCTLVDPRRAPALDKGQRKQIKAGQQRRHAEAVRASGGVPHQGSDQAARGDETSEGEEASGSNATMGRGDEALEYSSAGERCAPVSSADGGEIPDTPTGAHATDPTAVPLPFSHLRRPLDAHLEREIPALLSTASALVGMHPDEATEPIIDAALRHGRPFAVVPCCVFARALPKLMQGGGHVSTYEQLLAYLQAKHPAIKRTHLPFTGRNVVLFWAPEANGTQQDVCSLCA